MKVTYIHHSSFCVELESIVFLFDYYQGGLPEFPDSKPLVVFASHSHGDHYSPVIFDLAKERKNVWFVLSKDIKRKAPEDLADRVRIAGSGESFCLSVEGVKVKVETFHSTDEGVAFWIGCEGKELYHAGDLNNWRWEGESKAWNHNIAAGYSREMEKMKGRIADAAFVPLDPRQEQWFYLGLDEFMKTAGAKVVFPMHFWKDYSIIDKMKKHPASGDYRDRIVEIHREGEEFII